MAGIEAAIAAGAALTGVVLGEGLAWWRDTRLGDRNSRRASAVGARRVFFELVATRIKLLGWLTFKDPPQSWSQGIDLVMWERHSDRIAAGLADEADYERFGVLEGAYLGLTSAVAVNRSSPTRPRLDRVKDTSEAAGDRTSGSPAALATGMEVAEEGRRKLVWAHLCSIEGAMVAAFALASGESDESASAKIGSSPKLSGAKDLPWPSPSLPEGEAQKFIRASGLFGPLPWESNADSDDADRARPE